MSPSQQVTRRAPGAAIGGGKGLGPLRTLRTGAVRAVSVPSPSAPLSFEPQHQTESPSTTTTTTTAPVEVQGLSEASINTVEAGYYAGCASVGATGKVECWGINDAGLVGDGTTAATAVMGK